ncbi:MAG TPA: serine/threonine-protein kinase [Kofleriaceae bacterium]|nr:serine/threonine-protein kinase [Kofleriaceae bacterium]
MTEIPSTHSEHSEPASATCSARRAPSGDIASAPTGLAPQSRIGDWLIDRQIGAGGMGTVYAATHAIIGKRAAIKVVRAEQIANTRAADRFVQEARIVNSIGHPNIVDIFHIGWLDDQRPYLVMELLTGRTLGRRLMDGHPLPQETIGILVQICEALTFAHAHGVVHRDLKPQNIFLVETPAGTVVKLLDWGVAKLMDKDSEADTFTATGALVGTPHYIAPEQARAKAVDGRADVYSLGAIAYELFLGRPPFVADNIADLITMHLREPPPPPHELWPDIPAALEQLLLSMLAKTADGRPGIAEVRRALLAVRTQLESQIATIADAACSIVDAASAIDRIPTWDMPRPDTVRAIGSDPGSKRLDATPLVVALQPAPPPAEPSTSFFRALGTLALTGFRRITRRAR